MADDQADLYFREKNIIRAFKIIEKQLERMIIQSFCNIP